MVTCLGMGVEECFDAFCRGESGNAPLQAFDAAKYRMQRAYEICDRSGRVDACGRASKWLSMAIEQAVTSAGLDGVQSGIPVLVGTGLRELRSLELWWSAGHDFDTEKLHFRSAVRRACGQGRSLTVSNACSASLFTLGLASDMLALEEADAVVVAGTDSITESMFGLLDRVHPTPPSEVRPFDRQRRGVLLGEGAVAVVLEPPAAAAERGRQPLAWLRGVGMSCDAHHVTAPDQSGIARAIRDAHRRAAVRPEDVDLVLVHGTGTILNDETESLAMREVFGEAVTRPLFSALKSMIGHTSGASGLMSLVTAVECLRRGRVPPTVGHRDPIPEAAGLSFVTGRAREADLRVAQVNAFGFGGVNAVGVVERAA